MKRSILAATAILGFAAGCTAGDGANELGVYEAEIAGGHCARANRTYVSTSPEECALIRFVCAEGSTYFADACGCGCETPRGRECNWAVLCAPGYTFDPQTCHCRADRVRCGTARCPSGQVCCNESCGICTPPGGACIELYCEPV